MTRPLPLVHSISYPLFARYVAWLSALALLGVMLLATVETQAWLASHPGFALHAAEHVAPPGLVSILQAGLAVLLAVGFGALFITGYRVLVVIPRDALNQIDAIGVSARGPFDGASHEIARLAALLTSLASRCAGIESNSDYLERTLVDQSRDSGRALDLLFRASTLFAASAPDEDALRSLLEELVDCVGAQCGALLIHDVAAAELSLPAVLAARGTVRMPAGMTLHRLAAEQGVQRFDATPDGRPALLVMPIGDAVDRYGVLALEVTPKYVLERRQQRLLDTFASLLAVTIGNLLRSRRQRRVALMEERAAIARELHDSLAQTLSFVKIQLARMQAQARQANFADGIDARDWEESLAELRLGVDSAYRNLRQLLSAFRSSVGTGGLAQSLQVIVDDLSAVTRTSIELDCRVREIDLSPEEELHLLQIAREALSNVVRHARANHARVSVSEKGGELTLSVLDDGEGFATDTSDATDPAGHYGLSIMRERSERLGGRIEIGAANHPLAGAAAGSEVRLKFRPGSTVVP